MAVPSQVVRPEDESSSCSWRVWSSAHPIAHIPRLCCDYAAMTNWTAGHFFPSPSASGLSGMSSGHSEADGDDQRAWSSNNGSGRERSREEERKRVDSGLYTPASQGHANKIRAFGFINTQHLPVLNIMSVRSTRLQLVTRESMGWCHSGAVMAWATSKTASLHHSSVSAEDLIRARKGRPGSQGRKWIGCLG
jgi:hypothetical protein